MRQISQDVSGLWLFVALVDSALSKPVQLKIETDFRLWDDMEQESGGKENLSCIFFLRPRAKFRRRKKELYFEGNRARLSKERGEETTLLCPHSRPRGRAAEVTKYGNDDATSTTFSFFFFMKFQICKTFQVLRLIRNWRHDLRLFVCIIPPSCTVDFLRDFWFAGKTCRVEMIRRKNDILCEIIKNCSSEVMNN